MLKFEFQIAMTYDDQTVITVSETGTLCIWNVKEAEGKTVLVDPAFTFCTGVLIPKLELQDKVGMDSKIFMKNKAICLTVIAKVIALSSVVQHFEGTMGDHTGSISSWTKFIGAILPNAVLSRWGR